MIDIQSKFKNFFKGTKNPSLNAMKFFMNKYDNFEKEMKFIHIAGTNGKGSCTEILNNILIHAGYKVGKFMSPHLITYNERISINSVYITDSEMNSLLEELTPHIDEYNNNNESNITLFELETIMALLYFYRNNVDLVVLETGLGGLYDCTNIITSPLVSIITSIGYDHTQILGNTLSEIAFQKAGIIKPNSHTVIFNNSNEINNVFIKKSNEVNNTLHIVNQKDISNYSLISDHQYFRYKDKYDFTLNLKGSIQVQNSSLCIETMFILQSLGYNVSIENIQKGLSTVIHKGRCEVLNTSPLIIFDGAHNKSAILAFNNIVDSYYKHYKKIYILSVLKTKNIDDIFKCFNNNSDSLFILTSGNDDNLFYKNTDLYDSAISYIPKNNIKLMNLKNSIIYAINSDENTANFFIGSFYTYGTIVDEIKALNTKT